MSDSQDDSSTFTTTTRGFLSQPSLLTRPIQRSLARVPAHPVRYEIREEEGRRYLCGVESPDVRVSVDRGGAVSDSAVRKFPSHTIFLDGVFQGAPFIDRERMVFNLDHHEGVERSFTLAACEQASVLVLRGLDLKENEWQIRANEPDLDTLLAIWVLLNSTHLTREKVQKRALPLIRLEGVIDAHGLDLKALTGFSPGRLKRVEAQLETLMSRELALKRAGEWDSCDFLEYLSNQLQLVDRLVFPDGYFEGFIRLVEGERTNLGDDRLVVAVSEAEKGIYEVEENLKERYGKRLGIIVFQKDEGVYTLRQVDSFLPRSLDAVYPILNLLDPHVGRDSDNRWGGSSEIGGSPRRSGSGLKAPEVVSACHLAFSRPTGWRRLWSLLRASVMAFLGLGVGLLAWIIINRSWTLPEVVQGLGVDPLPFIGGFFISVAIFSSISGRGRWRLLGWSLPWSFDWLLLAPPAILAGLFGGSWTLPLYDPLGVELSWAPVVVLVLAVEILFRSLVHGELSLTFQVQRPGGHWFISWPTILSAVVFTAFTVLPPWPTFAAEAALGLTHNSWLEAFAAMIFALTLGIARERSGSFLVPWIFHLIVVATTLAITG